MWSFQGGQALEGGGWKEAFQRCVILAVYKQRIGIA